MQTRHITYRLAALGCAMVLTISTMAQILPNLGGQRAGLSALSFLKNDINPRSFAMGGASVAISGDEFATHTNPSGVADIQSFSLATSNFFVGAGINQSFITATMPLTSSSGLGLSINSLTSGAMEVRTEFQPEGTGQKIYASNVAAGLTYSNRLSDMFTMGVTLKYINERLAEYTNHTATFDLGFTYQTDFKNLAFAVMVQNFSGNSGLEGDFLAVDFNRAGTVNTEEYTAPTVFRMGASMTALEKENHEITVSFELQHPNDNAENFRFGAEYSYLKLIYFRTGIRLNVDGQQFPSIGVALRHRVGGHPLHLNYTVLPTQIMGTQHVVGLGFKINKDLKNDRN